MRSKRVSRGGMTNYPSKASQSILGAFLSVLGGVRFFFFPSDFHLTYIWYAFDMLFAVFRICEGGVMYLHVSLNSSTDSTNSTSDFQTHTHIAHKVCAAPAIIASAIAQRHALSLDLSRATKPNVTCYVCEEHPPRHELIFINVFFVFLTFCCCFVCILSKLS